MGNKSEFDGCKGRHEWTLDCCLLLIIGLDLWQVLEVVSDLLQESQGLVLLLVDVLDVVAHLSEHEISDGEVVVNPRLISLELGQVFQFRGNGFLPGLF